MLCSIAEEAEGRHGAKRWRIADDEVKDHQQQKSCTSLIAPITAMSSSHPATPRKAGIDNLLSSRVVTPEAVTSSLDAIVASPPSEDAGVFFHDTEDESDQEEVEVSLSRISTKVFIPPLESSQDCIHGQEWPPTTRDRPPSRWSLSSMDARLIPTTTKTQRTSMEMKWWLEHQRGKRLEFEVIRLLEECQTKQATLRLLTDELYAIRQERHKGIVAGSGLQHNNNHNKKSLIVSKIGESPNKSGTKRSKGLEKVVGNHKERRHRRTSSSSSASLHSSSDSSGGSQHTTIQVSMIVVSLYIMNGGRPILILVLSCAWMWAQIHIDDAAGASWIVGTSS